MWNTRYDGYILLIRPYLKVRLRHLVLVIELKKDLKLVSQRHRKNYEKDLKLKS